MSSRVNRKLIESDATNVNVNHSNLALNNSPPNFCCGNNSSTSSGQNSEGNSPTLTENRPTSLRRGVPNMNNVQVLPNGVGGGAQQGGGTNPMMIQSPRERLESFAGQDFDMLKPLLMYNIENIQSFRADCKYRSSKRLRQINKSKRR